MAGPPGTNADSWISRVLPAAPAGLRAADRARDRGRGGGAPRLGRRQRAARAERARERAPAGPATPTRESTGAGRSPGIQRWASVTGRADRLVARPAPPGTPDDRARGRRRGGGAPRPERRQRAAARSERRRPREPADLATPRAGRPPRPTRRAGDGTRRPASDPHLPRAGIPRGCAPRAEYAAAHHSRENAGRGFAAAERSSWAHACCVLCRAG